MRCRFGPWRADARPTSPAGYPRLRRGASTLGDAAGAAMILPCRRSYTGTGVAPNLPLLSTESEGLPLAPLAGGSDHTLTRPERLLNCAQRAIERCIIFKAPTGESCERQVLVLSPTRPGEVLSGAAGHTQAQHAWAVSVVVCPARPSFAHQLTSQPWRVEFLSPLDGGREAFRLERTEEVTRPLWDGFLPQILSPQAYLPRPRADRRPFRPPRRGDGAREPAMASAANAGAASIRPARPPGPPPHIPGAGSVG